MKNVGDPAELCDSQLQGGWKIDGAHLYFVVFLLVDVEITQHVAASQHDDPSRVGALI